MEWIPIYESDPEEEGGDEEARTILPTGFWSVELKDLKLGSESVLPDSAKITGLLDTGSSLIVGPSRDVGYLASEIGATCVVINEFQSPDLEVVSKRL